MGTLKYSEAGSFEEMAEKAEEQVKSTELPKTEKIVVTAEQFVEAAEAGVGPEDPAQDPGVAGTHPGVEKNETTE